MRNNGHVQTRQLYQRAGDRLVAGRLKEDEIAKNEVTVS
jgi:hypothetical protein